MENEFSKITNLCYIIKEDRVLLQKKARGFGIGKWNAPGGKKENNETIEESLKREVFEETNIILTEIEQVGYHEFIWKDKSDWNTKCFIFKVRKFEGNPKDMGEGELRWFEIDKIPLDEMWEDDKYWTKEMLRGNFQNMRFYFDENGNHSKHEIIK